MAKCFAVVNQKGGVGKTTTTMNMGAYLAALGQRVLIVDLDPQANATASAGHDHREVERGVYEVLMGDVPVAQAVRSAGHDNFWVLPATGALAGASVELVSLPQREFKLAQALAAQADAYDIVLIDCPPSLGLLTINGLVAADGVLIPIQAEYYALEGLGQLIETVRLVQEHIKPELAVFGAVITMFDPRTKLSRDVMEELRRHLPTELFQTVIPRSVRLAEAPSFGKTIRGYDPESRGAMAYRAFAQEFLARLQAQAQAQGADVLLAQGSPVAAPQATAA
jgi:chromosome partitioning protein